MADTFYRDEDGNPLCTKCAEETQGKLEMELTDEDDPIECDGCGEQV